MALVEKNGKTVYECSVCKLDHPIDAEDSIAYECGVVIVGTSFEPSKTSPDGISLIAEERQRQIKQEGWTPEHDKTHANGELALAAACYAAPGGYFDAEGYHHLPGPVYVGGEIDGSFVDPWPWDAEWDKRDKHNRVRQLVIAGALIAAEIDRIQGQS